MAQWINLQRINRFVNPMRWYISGEKSGDLYLAEPGLTEGCLVNELEAESEKFEAFCRLKYSILCFV